MQIRDIQGHFYLTSGQIESKIHLQKYNIQKVSRENFYMLKFAREKISKKVTKVSCP